MISLGLSLFLIYFPYKQPVAEAPWGSGVAMVPPTFSKKYIILLVYIRPNISLGPLSFTFVSHRSFKFLRFQIDPLSFEFVSDMSFKFIRFQIGPLSFEFVSDRSFNFGLTKVDRKDLSETNWNLIT